MNVIPRLVELRKTIMEGQLSNEGKNSLKMIEIMKRNTLSIPKERSSRIEMDVLLRDLRKIQRPTESKLTKKVSLSSNGLKNLLKTSLRPITQKTRRVKSSWIKKGNLSKDTSVTLSLSVQI